MGLNYSDLFYACLNSDVKTVKLCLKSGIDPRRKLYLYSRYGCSKFEYSSYNTESGKDWPGRHDYSGDRYTSSSTPTTIIDLVLEKKYQDYHKIIDVLLEYGVPFPENITINYTDPIADVLLKHNIFRESSIRLPMYDPNLLKKIIGPNRTIGDSSYLYNVLETNAREYIQFGLERNAPITKECFKYIDRYPLIIRKTNDPEVLSRGIDILLITSKTKVPERKDNLMYAEECYQRLLSLNKTYVKNIENMKTILDENDYEKTLFLVKLGYNPNEDYKTDFLTISNLSNEYCPIIYCVEKGFIQGTKALLESKADVNITDSSGQSLLELAGNNSEMIFLLIKHGAKVKLDFDPKDYIQAIKDCDISKIKELAKKGVNYKAKIENKTPLQYAIETKNTEVVDIVVRINLGMNVNEEMETGYVEPEEEQEGPGVDFPKIPSAPIMQRVSQKEEILS